MKESNVLVFKEKGSNSLKKTVSGFANYRNEYCAFICTCTTHTRHFVV